MDTIARMVVAIIRVNGATSDQQGLARNTVIVAFYVRIMVKGRRMRMRSRRMMMMSRRMRSVLEKATGWGRELFHVILICDGSCYSPLETSQRAIAGA